MSLSGESTRPLAVAGGTVVAAGAGASAVHRAFEESQEPSPPPAGNAPASNPTREGSSPAGSGANAGASQQTPNAADPAPPPYPPEQAAADAEELRRATYGWGTDEDAVFRTLEGKSPEQIDAIRQSFRQQYGEELDTVIREDFEGDGPEGEDRAQSALLGGPYRVQQSLGSARATPTGGAVIAAAERQGVPVYVLPDEEYSARFPGSAGVTTEDGIYVPVSSVDEPNDSNVVVHEYVHAVVGDAFNLPDSADRETAIRERFEEIGLNPEDGAQIARETAWREELTGFTDEHVATWLVTRDIEREMAGLPPDSPQKRQEIIRRAAERELAIALTNKRANEPGYTDGQFVADWLSTPQGQRTPLPGNTDAERARALEELLADYKRDTYPEYGSVSIGDKLNG